MTDNIEIDSQTKKAVKKSPQLKTDTQIQKAIKQVIKDGKSEVNHNILGCEGLRLRIRLKKNGTTTSTFCHKYAHLYIKGKPVVLTLGNYPSFTLEQARTAHRDNLSLLAQGIDPKSHGASEKQAKAQSITNTFEAIANHWLAEQTSNTNNMPAKQTIYSWNIYLEPLINEFGKQSINTITSQQVINLCKRIQKKHISKGNSVHGMANRIFSHAILHGQALTNPVQQIQGARVLKTQTTNSHPALVNPKEFAYLLNDIEQIDNPRQPFNKPILQLLSLTFVRIGDICSMKWCDIDLIAKQWVFEPQKGKSRGDMISSLIVPLAPQTIQILKDMQQVTGSHDYVFYNHRRKAEPYHNTREVNKVLNDSLMNIDGVGEHYEGKGYLSVHSPHGFRASAKTMLMERLGYDELITEMQLGHRMLNKYGTAYNRMEAIEKRTTMMTAWADYLDDLKAGKTGKRIYHDFKTSDQTGVKIRKL